MIYTQLKTECSQLLIDENYQIQDKLDLICKLLHQRIEYYDWVGFYFMDQPKQELQLGPYIGTPTDHIRIPYGQGICGQVAVSGSTYLAEDVNAESNYIACSIDVKSEIVVPIYSPSGQLLAQIDIDSSTPKAFTKEDESFLVELCAEIGTLASADLEYDVFFATGQNE